MSSMIRPIPHNMQEELDLLAVLLYHTPIRMGETFQKLRGEQFYSEAFGIVYDAMRALWEADKDIDLITVTDALRRSEKLEYCGGAGFLVELEDRNRADSTPMLVAENRILLSWGVRRMIRFGKALTELGYEGGEETDHDDRIRLYLEAGVTNMRVAEELFSALLKVTKK